MQSEQHLIYRRQAGGGAGTQANMEETEGERLPRVEAHNSQQLTRKKGAPRDQV